MDTLAGKQATSRPTAAASLKPNKLEHWGSIARICFLLSLSSPPQHFTQRCHLGFQSYLRKDPSEVLPGITLKVQGSTSLLWKIPFSAFLKLTQPGITQFVKSTVQNTNPGADWLWANAWSKGSSCGSESQVSWLKSSCSSSHGASDNHSLFVVSGPLHFCFNSLYDFTVSFLSSLDAGIYSTEETSQHCESFQLHLNLWVLNVSNKAWLLIINNFEKLITRCFLSALFLLRLLRQSSPENSAVHILLCLNQCS